MDLISEHLRNMLHRLVMLSRICTTSFGFSWEAASIEMINFFGKVKSKFDRNF